MNHLELESLTNEFNEIVAWRATGFASPPPDFIKKGAILRHLSKLNPSETIFIETGTLTGSTSKLVAEFGYKVITIELARSYFESSRKLLEPLGVTCLCGDSGDLLPSVIDNLPSGLSVFMWLDGHYSGGETALGDSETPIVQELLAVEKLLLKSRKPIIVKIDDIRIFGNGNYPQLDHVVDFCRKNMLFWAVELDSFIFSNRKQLLL
jgi:hypothetical protein